MDKKIICIVQARTGSTRLPNKIFLDLQGKTVLGQVIDRLNYSKLITQIVIAAPNKKEDDVIEEFVKKNYEDVGIYRGSEDDVLDRYYQAAKKYNADVIIRITSDCPLIDSVEVDKVIQAYLDNGVDYCANILGKRTYPRGLDTEVFSWDVLSSIWHKALEKEDREHVTLYIRKHPKLYSTYNVEYIKDYSQYRITLDTPEDYALIQLLYKQLFPDKLDIEYVVDMLESNQELIDINKHIKQKYGQY
ncbi:glycosyltransferase family protein [Patescibacteria group bacterium]|nr:glycosyltransferase family protein [Patescibacteria group bacterium]MBU1722103.1 glycosyltransferase family protein [Patescibacteria group bacterium]MBU1901593.1 glycosyltransferase family protein [Patescibacteria group bacterium]